MPPETLTIAEHLRRRAELQPNGLALVSPSGSLTYAELDNRSESCARGLAAIGIASGVRVALMVRPGPEFAILSFGLIKAGTVPVLIDPGIGRQALGRCLAEAKPLAFVGIPLAHLARILLGWARSSVKVNVVVGRSVPFLGHTYGEVLRRGDEQRGRTQHRADLDGPAAIVFTSGSTGTPKGVVYSHRMFSRQVELLRETFHIEEGEVDLATFPLFALFDPGLGVTTVFPKMDFTRPGHVDPLEILGSIRENRVTHMFGSPALLNRVGRFAEEQGIRLSGLKRVLSAGAPVSPRILKRFAGLLDEGCEVHTPYGATEALPVTTIGSNELLNEKLTEVSGKGTCVGRPLQGVDVRLIRIQDSPVVDRIESEWIESPGCVGELVVSGDNVSREYFERPEANRLAKVRGEDGRVWHRMGDLGFFDDKGRVWFCGRKSHRVITPQGELFSVQCESLYNRHPQVFRSALVGVGSPPHQRPVLCVEPESGTDLSDREALGREILALGEGDPKGRQIETLLFHPSFPVDIRHNAKIFREKLAAWAEEQLR